MPGGEAATRLSIPVCTGSMPDAPLLARASIVIWWLDSCMKFYKNSRPAKGMPLATNSYPSPHRAAKTILAKGQKGLFGPFASSRLLRANRA